MRRLSVPLVVLGTVLGLGVLFAVAGAALVLGGVYDVAATQQHWQRTFDVLDRALRQSVRLRARGIEEPALSDEQTVLRGAACFRAKCEHCHGGPGVAPGDAGKSMQPLPGPLVDAARHWRPRELYWITRNGLRMTGMPAWAFHLTDEELWALVAFMQVLPERGVRGYADAMRQAPPPADCGRAVAVATGPVDASRGREALHQHACNSCHRIPGATGPR